MTFVLLADPGSDPVYTWIETDGTEHPLIPSSGFTVPVGTSSRWNTPQDYAEQTVPGQPGTRMRQIKVQPRDLDLPLVVEAGSFAEKVGKLRNLAAWFSTRSGPGRLRVDMDATSREIAAYAAPDLDGGQSTPQVSWVAVGLHCPDPYWYDAIDQIATYTTGATTPFLPASFPMLISSTTVLASPTVTNGGDDDAWPVWTITGPGTNPALRNLTSGKSLVFDLTLGAGEQAIIDTRPGYKSVTDGQGGNLYQALSRTATLWPLARGTNRLSIELANATAASSVELVWQRRWLGP